MTHAHQPDELLAHMVPGTLGLWAPPLVMGVTGDPEVFGPVAAGLKESHMSVPGHALRVAQATVTGITNPGDGTYAARLRAMHEHWGITPALLARVWQWGTVFIAKADALTNGPEAHSRASALLRASQVHGKHVNADPAVVGQPLSVDEQQVRDHFMGITSVPGAAVDAFWQVADHPKIRELLPANITDQEVLGHCGQFLPPSFVSLFAR